METVSTVALTGPEELSLAYTPGVARVCEAIAADPSLTQHYTWVPNTVAVVTDGTAVLGLGDIGPAAAMPVMEGKAVLFKQFGGVDAVPICLDTTDAEEIIETVVRLAPSFGGINLEDISAPRCFEIEAPAQGARSTSRSSTTTSTARRSSCWPRCTNALRLTGRDPATMRVVVQGAGAAGVAVARILLDGRRRATSRSSTARACSTPSAPTSPRSRRRWPATPPTTSAVAASLADVMAGADVYIGVSGGTVPEEVVAVDGRRRDHLRPGQPDARGAPRRRRTATRGSWPPAAPTSPTRSTTCSPSPASSAGAFDVHATAITEGMKVAAAAALAELVGDAAHRGARRAVAVRPPRGAGGVGGGRRGRTAGRRRPPLTPLSRLGGCAPSTPSPSRPTTRSPAWWSASAPSPRRPTGGRPSPCRAAALNHHDLWSLRGVGLREEQLPMILGCDAAGIDEDGNEVVVHAVDQRPDVDRATRPSTRGARCSPSGTRAPSPSGSPCRGRNVVPKPAVAVASRRPPACRPPG